MTTSAEPQRISGPSELVQAIPYLLGFHPRRSLVLVGVTAGQLVVTARLDLDDAAEPRMLSRTVQTLRRGGSTEIVAALFDDDVEVARSGQRWSGIVVGLEDAADAAGCAVDDVLAVSGGRWRSIRCRFDDCCPPDGRPLPTAPSAFATAATVAGVVALPDRRALEDLLEPLPEADRARLAPPLEAAEHEFVTAVLDGASVRLARSVKRALFGAARRADEPGWDGLDAVTAARFGVALGGAEVRNAVWLAVDDGRLDGRGLWRELARRLPGPYNAPPLFIYGWAAWRAGDGALAGIAAERALASDPDFTAADLLLAALANGVDPRRLPKLRLPRPA